MASLEGQAASQPRVRIPAPSPLSPPGLQAGQLGLQEKAATFLRRQSHLGVRKVPKGFNAFNVHREGPFCYSILFLSTNSRSELVQSLQLLGLDHLFKTHISSLCYTCSGRSKTQSPNHHCCRKVRRTSPKSCARGSAGLGLQPSLPFSVCGSHHYPLEGPAPARAPFFSGIPQLLLRSCRTQGRLSFGFGV